MSNEESKVLYVKTGRVFTIELLRAFKAECARRGKSMTEVLASLIREWIGLKEQS